MRGTPTRAPYWPQAMRPIDLPPSRNSLVSWSESKDRATAQRAAPGHSSGRNFCPARTRLTSLRQCSSDHCQGSRSGWGVFISASSSVRAGGEGEAGRSGEIRTHDPQHPMLMRYQAALRSDRGGSADGIDNSDRSRWTQPAGHRGSSPDAPASRRRHLGRGCALCLIPGWTRDTVINLVLQCVRGAEDKNAPRADRYFLAGLRIATDALTLLSDREAAERGNFDHLSAFKRARDFGDHRFDELRRFITG